MRLQFRQGDVHGIVTFQARQGDVWIEAVDRLPQGVKLQEVAPEQGYVVLAYGEVTGHSHRIAAGPAVRLLAVPGLDDRFLEIGGDGAEVRHEEHAPIPLPPGRYRVRIQREYVPGAIRWVVD